MNTNKIEIRFKLKKKKNNKIRFDEYKFVKEYLLMK